MYFNFFVCLFAFQKEMKGNAEQIFSGGKELYEDFYQRGFNLSAQRRGLRKLGLHSFHNYRVWKYLEFTLTDDWGTGSHI